MKKFFINFSVFLLVSLVSISIFFFVLIKGLNLKYTDFPDPDLTKQISYAQKLALIKNRKVDILTIGSSIADNNINSKEVVSYYQNKNFFNVSAAGVSLEDELAFLNIYYDINKYKKVILLATLADFWVDGKKSGDYEEIKKYLQNTTDRFSIKKFRITNFKFAIKNKDAIANVDSVKKSYDFDYYGCEIIKKTNVTKEQHEFYKKIFNETFENFKKDQDVVQRNLTVLSKIVQFCIERNIEFTFVQCPINEYYLRNRPDIIKYFKGFTDEQAAVVHGAGVKFVKTYDKVWQDSLYNDSQHMNEMGSKQLTDYILSYPN